MVLIGNSAKLNSELKESLTDLFLSFMKSYTFELIRLAPTNMKCSQLKCPRCTNCSAGGLATSRSSTSNKKILRSSGAHLQFTITIKLWSNENRKLFCSSQTICFPLALHLSISVLDFCNRYLFSGERVLLGHCRKAYINDRSEQYTAICMDR